MVGLRAARSANAFLSDVSERVGSPMRGRCAAPARLRNSGRMPHPATDSEAATRPAFFALVAASTVYFVAQGMLFPILPRYVKRELGGGGFAIGIAVSSFAIGAMIARPWGGHHTDRIGRRADAAMGLVQWSAMVVCYQVAGDTVGVGGVVATRIVGGLGGGALFVALATMATELTAPEHRVRGFGVFSSSTLIGFAIGPAIGVAVLDQTHYRRAFLTCACIALSSVVAVVLLPDTRPAHMRERRATRRTAPLLHPAARRSGLALMLGSLGFITFAAFVPVYADEVGLEHVQIALTLTAAVNLTIRLAFARVADRVARRTLSIGSLCFVIAAALTLALWAAPAGILTAAVLNGIGNAFLFPGFLAMTVDAVSEDERAVAIGSLTVFSDLASSAGGAILGVAASSFGYRGAFAVGAALAAGSLAIVVMSSGQRMPATRPA